MTKDAQSDWTNILGEAYVISNTADLQTAENATFKTEQSIPIILRPKTLEEVQACIRIANKYHYPIAPISTGNNWGYGSSVPWHSGCALLDLSRMNQILDFDETLAYVTLEPGVTQQQLYSFLEQQQSQLWMDATGSSPSCSVIGNTLERGFGHTPYGDHFRHVCGLEVVLATGETIQTGFGRFKDAKAKNIYHWGVGPYIDGLFSQSNFGVVTKMTIWLMPAPEYFQAFYFNIDRDESLPPLIDALRPLRMNGTIQSAIHIGNHYKVIASMQAYPWRLTQGITPMPQDVLQTLMNQLGIGVWNGSGGLYGTRQQVAEARRLLKRAVQHKVTRLQFLDDELLSLASRVAKPYQWFTGIDVTKLLKLLRPVYGLMKGVPTDSQIASTYWRKPDQIETEYKDPDKDRCGLMWCAPIAPLNGEDAIHIQRIAYSVLSDAFEPMISITLITERSLSCLITIAFDRDKPGEDDKALTYYQRLSDQLARDGYYPYRVGVQDNLLTNSDTSYQKFLGQLKANLDPHNILAPNKYWI